LRKNASTVTSRHANRQAAPADPLMTPREIVPRAIDKSIARTRPQHYRSISDDLRSRAALLLSCRI